MASIVGVQFQKNGKVYNYDTNGLDLKPEQFVVCDTVHGTDLGQVVVGCREIDVSESGIALKKVIRTATEKDLRVSSENRTKEREAFVICQKKIAEHKLDMKLVSVEYSFDNSKAMFYFTANGRVDFRSLVKDLASVFRMRIELRQIGVRDEARMIGGLGPCGRQICCGAFLDEFQPVSIKMAKEQNLSLNPTKISGVCGRLMCCLKYEQEHYEQTRKIMPRVGREVITPDGTGVVTDLNIVKETVFVRIANGDSSEIKEYPLEKIEKTGQNHNLPQNQGIQHEKNEKEAGTETEEVSDTALQDMQSGKNERNRNDRVRDDTERESGGTGSKRNERGQEKNNDQRRSDRQSRLGKPVMRENPNRAAAPQAQAGSSEKPEEKQGETPKQKKEEKPEQNHTAPASSWAEAVKKAMDSIR